MKPTQKQVIAWARKAGIAKYGLGWTCWDGQLERFTTLVYEAGRKEEREACAKVCEDWTRTPETTGMELSLCAKAIQARGQE